MGAIILSLAPLSGRGIINIVQDTLHFPNIQVLGHVVSLRSQIDPPIFPRLYDGFIEFESFLDSTGFP